MDFGRTLSAMLLLWIAGSGCLGLADFGADRMSSRPSVRSRPYGYLILLRAAVLVATVVVLIFLARLIALVQGELQPSELIPAFLDRLTHRTTLAALAYVAVATGIITFIKQMVDRSGMKVMLNLIMGKYQNPREEDRIFMFLDLRSSTTIAEKLGHIRYSRLIQNCFRDLTDCAIRREVEIYQYVGDEAVLTWEMELRGNNCIRVFFDFNDTLQERAEYYRDLFGIIPEFKAGVNAGTVMVAEVGVLKREIAYHSDVLNTAARIQSKCNELGYDLLISAQTKGLLPADPGFQFTSVGKLELRGKEETVEILGVDMNRESGEDQVSRGRVSGVEWWGLRDERVQGSVTRDEFIQKSRGSSGLPEALPTSHRSQ